MFFRTLKTYFTLIFGVISKYRYIAKAEKIREEQGIAAGDGYICEIAFDVLKRTLEKTGANVIVTGQENIPDDTNFVLIANHQSMTDIFVIAATLGKPIGFISKAELEKIPILRQWMLAIGCVFMNRSDMKASVKAIIEGIKKVKAGDNICIFPEGTRTDGKMLEFKAGSFKLATKSGAPILPLTIDGTHRILEDNHLWIKNATVKLTYHPIVETKGLSKDEQNVLPAKIQEIVGSALKEEERFGKDENTDC